MARISAHTDQLLLRAGRTLARERGCSALSVREVARLAGVNLGMFHYHFKTKSNFKRRLLQDMYEDFFLKLTSSSKEGADAQGQLRSCLHTMATFLRDERDLYVAIVTDLVKGDPEAHRFLRDNLHRHAAVIEELVGKCQKEGTMKRLPFTLVMPMLMSSLHGATLIGGMIEKGGKRGPRTLLVRALLSDEAIAERVEFALKGLAP